MRWRQEFSKFKALFGRRDPVSDLAEEIRSHLRLEELENRESGMSSEEARFAAMRHFGNITIANEKSRDMWRWTSVEQIFQDLRFGFRQLRRNLGFTIFAVLTLALGIGANSAIFSVVNGVLLRPLPFARPERLVDIWEAMPKRNISRLPVPPGNYLDWRARNHVLSNLGGFVQAGFSATSTGEPERYIGAYCDEGLFPTLGVTPILGHGFSANDNIPGHDAVIVLSYGLWKKRFGGDPNVLGRQMVLDGRPRTIIGIMPERFSFPAQSALEQSALWVPFAWSAELRTRRDSHFVHVIGRLQDGVSLAQARSGFSYIATNLAKDHPAFNQDELIEVRPVMDDLVGNLRPAFIALASAVGFLLLIACTNIANLLLAKAAQRARELAVRASLGAGPLRILRQLLVESLLLSLTGGMAGLILAGTALHAILLLAPASIPRLAEVHLDRNAILFTAALSILSGIFFGVVPAWSASRSDLHSVLKTGARGNTGRIGLRNALVMLQVGAAVVLLAGAGLLVRSFYTLLQIDAGFNPAQVVTARLTPAPSKYDGHPNLEIQLARNILRNVAAVPGIQKSAIGTDIPILGHPTFIMRIEGKEVSPSQAPITAFFSVTPAYFDVMGMRLVQGRLFNNQDLADTPLVVVVNETLARKYFPGQSAIGKRIEVTFQDTPRWRQIVGVIADVHTDGLAAATPVEVYGNFLQMPGVSPDSTPEISVVAKSQLDSAAAGEGIKAAILRTDRAQPVFAVQSMEDVFRRSISERRFALTMIAGFAGLALFLAAFGIYSVMSYTVAQRTSEIGIRMSLGAKLHQVLWMIGCQGLILAMIGLSGGLLAASVLTQFLKTLLFGIEPLDPGTFIGAAGLLLFVSILACCLPAWRASRVEPLSALRQE
jgi:putative ABC transport system permease protein